MPTGILRPDSSALLVIDIQERLMPVIAEADRVFANTNRLIEGADLLEVPVVVTEQYPRGLGSTCDEIRLNGRARIGKNCFSGLLHDEVAARVEGRRSLVLCGVEAHICVLKTALDALERGFEVHVAADAVSSRTSENHLLAVERMRQSGVFIASTEMLLFQWIDFAGTDTFKAISKLIK